MSATKVAVMLSTIVFGACASVPADDAPVRALRYRQFSVETADEYYQDGGEWLDNLFLPDLGIACSVYLDARITRAPRFVEVPMLFACRSTLEKELGRRPDSVIGRQPAEETTVSASFARAVARLVEITEQQNALAEALGADAASGSMARAPLKRDFGPIPRDRGR